MNWKEGVRQPGVPAALGAALLFGAGTPLAKWLLDAVDPWLLAGLLYLGSGVELTLYRQLSHDLPFAFTGMICLGLPGRFWRAESWPCAEALLSC